MTDETTIDATPDGGDESQAKKGGAESGGLKKYLLLGGIAVGALVVSMVLVIMLTGGDNSSTDEAASGDTETAAVEKTSESHGEAPAHDSGQGADATSGHEKSAEDLAAEADANLDFLIDESDQSVMDQIAASLEYLDYDPRADELGDTEEDESSGMSHEDSVEAVNWLEAEKATLAEREKQVTQREKELSKLDREVQRKILIIEQAESNRISKLAKLYDGMDARAVTKLMANLDDATVVAIISRMKQKNASSVLALISPKRAARLSKMMITIAEN